MRPLFTILFLFIVDLCVGQTLYPAIRKTSGQVSEFVPKGWSVLARSKGDLNQDGYADLALVLQSNDSLLYVDEGDTVNARLRVLVVAFRTADSKGYRLVLQHNTYILAHVHQNMADPFEGMEIKNGRIDFNFRIFYNMGSWTTTNATYSFRYRKGAFVLTYADIMNLERSSLNFEQYKYDFTRSLRILIKGNDENGRERKFKKVIEHKHSLLLQDISQPFSIEVEEGVLL